MNRARFVALCSLVAWTAGCGSGKRPTTAPARSWTAPATLDDAINPESSDARLPQVAMDDHGNAIVVWYEKDAADQGQVYMSEYRNGAWKHPAGLADSISLKGQDARFPRVAMGNNGDAIIVWSQYDGDDSRIYKSEYRNGRWMHPAGFADCIDAAGGSQAKEPAVAMDDSGNALIAWLAYDGARWGAYKAEYRSGSWNYPADLADRLNVATTSVWNRLQVAMDGAGDAVVAWEQEDASTPPALRIYKADHRGGRWIKPVNLAESVSPALFVPALLPALHAYAGLGGVAMGDHGESIIVWSGLDGSSNWQIYRSEYRSGKWMHPADPNDRTSLAGQSTNSFAVAMDAGGDAIVAWSEYDGISTHVYKREYRGGQWTGPSGFGDFVDPVGLGSGGLAVAMSDGGGALIAWSAGAGVSAQLYKAEYRDGKWTSPSSATDHLSVAGSTVLAWTPGLALDASGDAVVAWIQGDVTSKRILLAEYR